MYNNVGSLIKERAFQTVTFLASVLTVALTLLMLPILSIYISLFSALESIGILNPDSAWSLVILIVLIGFYVAVYVMLCRIIRAYFARKAMMIYAFGELVENVSKMAMDLIIANGPSGYIEGIGRYEINGNVIQLIDI